MSRQWVGPERRHDSPPTDVAFSSYRMALAVFFPMVLIMGAILGIKLVHIGPVLLSGGAFVFPWTFGILVIMTEVYGLRAGTKLAQMGSLMLLTASVLLYVVTKLPLAPHAGRRSQEFMDLFGAGPVALLLTNLALAVGFSVTLLVTVFLLHRTRGRVLWIRVWLAPTLGQIAAPLVVVPISLFEARVGAMAVVQAELGRAFFALLYGTAMAPVLAWIIVRIREADSPLRLVPADALPEAFRSEEGDG